MFATSFTRNRGGNPDIIDGEWRCINLMLPPFNLVPVLIVNEDCKEGYPHYSDKCMILLNYKLWKKINILHQM